jgi:hypothetical protein
MIFDLILDVMKTVLATFSTISSSLSQDRVQSSRWDGAIFLMIPGAWCLATIVLSLRDKIHLTAEALLKLALMGWKPWAEFCAPSEQNPSQSGSRSEIQTEYSLCAASRVSWI